MTAIIITRHLYESSEGENLMRSSIPDHHPLRHFFGMLAERSFLNYLRWDDLHVTSYIGELLLRFIDIDQLYKIRDRNGDQVGTVTEMLYESDILLAASSFEREQEVHRHIGDFTLFMSGIFPQYLQRITSSGMIHHGDFLIDYIKTGKRSYAIAAEYKDDCHAEHTSVWQKLADNFELCVVGLDHVRATLDHLQESHYLKAHQRLLH